ncbi:ROK family protein [Aquincola sp. MAHUQ-54]|uniref:ROK family protein n=1 Tax=Aquincola agrisoli TaxID=3119538 RepID=A0AAW9Q626_9BURK
MDTTPAAAPTRDPLTHGSCDLPDVRIDGYSLDIEDEDGQVGDRASQTAFRELLTEWRERLEKAGRDPLGPTPSEEMSKSELDRLAREGDTEAVRTISLAVVDFSEQLSHVVQRLRQHPSWKGVEGIVVGGGFKESDIGRLAIRQAGHRLAYEGVDLWMRPIHHAADDAGLVGGLHLIPHLAEADAGGLLAVDIGGTNVRCGVVVYDGTERAHLAKARVVEREKWRHADDDPQQNDLVEGIVGMLKRLIRYAEGEGIALAPFISVACPGVILSHGAIERGAHNLPGDWHRASFHLPRRLQENIPVIGGHETAVVMHNDAVVQGLSELPFLDDAERWAVLTIGTGLGNASYTTRRRS